MSRKRSSSQCTPDSSIEAVFSEQRDEARPVEGRLTHATGGALHEGQHLGPALAQRDEHASARPQLLDQRRLDLGSPPGDPDGIVGPLPPPPHPPPPPPNPHAPPATPPHRTPATP